MRKILAVLVLMVVGLSSVFAELLETNEDYKVYGNKYYPGLVYISETEVLRKVDDFHEFLITAGYIREGERISFFTESEVYSNKDIPDYIKGALKEGFAYSCHNMHHQIYVNELGAYRLKDGRIMIVNSIYRRVE